MGEYISALFGVCIVSGVICVMAPEGQSKRYLDIICSLCVICAVGVPLANSIFQIKNIGYFFDGIEYETSTNYDEIYNQYLTNGYLEEAEQLMAEQLTKRYSLPQNSIDIRLDSAVNGDSVEVIGATAIIGAAAVAVPPDEIKTHIKQSLGVECVIIYESVGG